MCRNSLVLPDVESILWVDNGGLVRARTICSSCYVDYNDQDFEEFKLHANTLASKISMPIVLEQNMMPPADVFERYHDRVIIDYQKCLNMDHFSAILTKIRPDQRIVIYNVKNIHSIGKLSLRFSRRIRLIITLEYRRVDTNDMLFRTTLNKYGSENKHVYDIFIRYETTDSNKHDRANILLDFIAFDDTKLINLHIAS